MLKIDRSVVTDFFSGIGAEIYQRCEKTLNDFSMKELLHSGVLVGFSGGADSMLLLCFLLEYKRRNSLDFTILPVHVNHGIRGEEANRDEEFCIEVTKALDLSIEVRRFSVPEIASASSAGIEEAARNVRYSSFNEIIRGRNDISAISVAHNMTDNSETVIFNILRGSGSRGGRGISPVRDNIIRPLIKISKSEILGVLDSYGIPYVLDSTNLETDYTRNYIRQDILPRLYRLSDSPDKMISRFSDNLRSDDEFICNEAQKLLDEKGESTNRKLLNSHPALYYRALSQMAGLFGCSISNVIANDIRNLLSKDNFTYSIIGGRFLCERGRCYISVDSEKNEDFCFKIKQGVNSICPDFDIILSTEKLNNNYLNIYKFSTQANLSSAIIDGDLYVRPKKDGDAIFYGGMTHKLKKLFNDRKIPLSHRKNIPILCDNKGVVWVPGFGVRDDMIPKEQKTDIFISLGFLTDRKF